MDDINWNLASNTQLKEECDRLEKEFKEKQKLMENTHKQMVELSKQYVEVKKILDKRQGKRNGSTK